MPARVSTPHDRLRCFLDRYRSRHTAAPRRVLYSAATMHAPRGGVEIKGKRFTGGEFVFRDDSGSGSASSPASAKTAVKHAVHVPSPRGPGPTPGARPAKPKPIAAQLAPARRVGTGKDAAVVLADGQPAPPHIKPSMVPPEWTEVHIATNPDAEVLVKARDKAGRTKTVYSESFAMKTAALKFARIREMLGKADAISGEVQRDRQSNDPVTRDAADLTFLIEQQATRPGSDGDTKARVKAYGATTLRGEHVIEAPDGVRLQFVGKEGVAHDHLVRDPDLAAMLLDRKKTADQRGGKLFSTNAARLNKYISSLDGGMFTAKDFRTLRGTRLAIERIRSIGACCDKVKDYKARVKEVAEHVSHVLGNRPSQALESYIDPTVFSVWSHPGA